MDKKNGIKCTVENCHYNNAHSCEANSIEVRPMGNGVAESCEGTSCSTFKKHDARA